MSKLYQSKSWLTKRYILDRKTIEEIGKECSASHQTIYRYLVKFDLLREQRKWSR